MLSKEIKDEINEIISGYKRGISRFGYSEKFIGYDLSEELSEGIYQFLKKLMEREEDK